MAKSFALVLTLNPPAADIFKRTAFLDRNGQFEVGALRRVKMPSWDECEGRILAIDFKKKLEKLNVNEAGEIMEEGETSRRLMNRYQELIRRKKEGSSSRREEYLRSVTLRLSRAGPSEILNPATGRSALRLPKKHTEAEKQRLQTLLDSLACYKESTGDIKLSADHEIYMSGSKVVMLQCIHHHNPRGLLTGMLAHLLPIEVASHPALSRTGLKGTVRVPPQIVQAANVSVLSFFKSRGIPVDLAEYNLPEVVRNFLYAAQHPWKGRSSSSSSNNNNNNNNQVDFEVDSNLDGEELAINANLPATVTVSDVIAPEGEATIQQIGGYHTN